jgi:predicted dehydrogenase
MVKIGIMSFAHMHAAGYAGAVNELPNAELSAAWDDDAKRGRAMAKQFNTKFIASRDAFFAAGLDAVIVTSENVKHREMVEAAAQAGLWILCEKPLATTVADAKAMIAACKKAKVGLGTAFPCRYIAPLMSLKEQVDAGELGELYAASCTNNGSNPGGWFADPKLSGGGATMDHTVHVADLLRWITGKEITKVYCEMGNVIHKKLGTDDIGSIHMEMEGGIKASHIASWSRAKSFPTWGDVTIELVGEQGVARLNAFLQKIDVYSDAAHKAEWVYWGGNSDLGLVGDFVQSVIERRDPAVTGTDGLRAVEVTVAAYKSAETGRMVSV